MVTSAQQDKIPPTDEALAAEARSGSSAATDELLARFSSAVRRTAAGFAKADFNRNTALDYDDYVQYGLLGLCSAIRAYRPDRSAFFRTFAARCIENSMSSAAKKHGARKPASFIPVPIEEMTDLADSGKSPEDEYIDREMMKEIDAVISGKLTGFEREALLAFTEGRSYRDIAGRTGRTVKAVDGALRRARKKIADSLSGGAVQ